MTKYDVLIHYDQAKADELYKFLKSVRCSYLKGSNLVMTYMQCRPPAKAYRIQIDSRNRYKYCYSLLRWDIAEAPIELNEFMERTVKI